MLLFPLVFNAQNILYPMLKGVKVLNYRFDYSLFTINKIDAKDYYISYEAKTDNPEKEYDNFIKKLETVFIASANNLSLIPKGYKLSNKDNLPYEVVIYIENADKDGEHKVGGIIVDKNINLIITSLEINVDGGNLNTFYNLFFEKLNRSGEVFGDKLADKILKKAGTTGREKKTKFLNKVQNLKSFE